jgi:hypothetical protein
MSVNTVSVVGPRSEPQKQEKEAKDPLDTILQGLQIAQGVTGIAVNYQNFNKLRAENSQLEDQAKGIVSQEGVMKNQTAGLRPAKEGEEGAVNYKVRTGEGDEGVKEMPFILQGKTEKESGSVQKVMGPNGPIYAFVTGKEKEPYKPVIEPKDPKEDKTPANTADLRKEYNNQPTTKTTYGVVENFNKIEQNLANKNPTGASDMSLVYSFMKMNDPTSTVREGEYATAENAGGVSDKIVNVYNRLKDGQRLTPEQRQAFAEEAKGLLGAQLKAQEAVDRRYADIANKFKLEPSFIVEPSFAELRKPPQNSPSAQPGGPGQAVAAPAAKVDDKVSAYANEHQLDYQTARGILVNRGYKPNE